MSERPRSQVYGREIEASHTHSGSVYFLVIFLDIWVGNINLATKSPNLSFQKSFPV